MSQIVASLHEGLPQAQNGHLGAAGLQPLPPSLPQQQELPHTPQQAGGPLEAESFALVVHPDGEVRSCASGGLRDPALYPHFAAACKYLVGAIQLDAAALSLRRRCEDPSVLMAVDTKPQARMQPRLLACSLLSLIPCLLPMACKACIIAYLILLILAIHLRNARSCIPAPAALHHPGCRPGRVQHAGLAADKRLV